MLRIYLYTWVYMHIPKGIAFIFKEKKAHSYIMILHWWKGKEKSQLVKTLKPEVECFNFYGHLKLMIIFSLAR